MTRAAGDGVAPPRDRGASLVEILVAVVLLGLACLGVLPAVTGTVKASGLQDRLASSRQWIVAAGEFAVSDGLPRAVCATADHYVAPIRTAVAGNRPGTWNDTQLTVESVRYWNGTAFVTTCPETAMPSLRLQEITLRVKSPDGRVDVSLTVVKADG